MKLQAQSHEFGKEVIRVTDGVYVAVGYDGSVRIIRDTFNGMPG